MFSPPQDGFAAANLEHRPRNLIARVQALKAPFDLEFRFQVS
jgi:hypothetical protein